MSDRPGSEPTGTTVEDLSCEVCADENPHFAAGDRWILAGVLNMDTAASVLEASAAAELPASGIVSLARVDGVDSAAVAVLLAWRRRAVAEGKTLSFSDVPETLSALAELYDVEDLISRPVRSAA
jgi:phospholipid transport system transporter-binding protein